MSNGSATKPESTKVQPTENSPEIDLGDDISADEPTATGAQATITAARSIAAGAVIAPMPQALAATVKSISSQM